MTESFLPVHDGVAPFRVSLLTSIEPRLVMCLIQQIERESPVRIAGVLYHLRARPGTLERVRRLLRELRDPTYIFHVFGRIKGILARLLDGIFALCLWLFHAYRPPKRSFGLGE